MANFVEIQKEVKGNGDSNYFEDGYIKGFKDGITAYAWMKGGIYYVGTSGRTLKEAEEKMKDTFNYFPRRIDI